MTLPFVLMRKPSSLMKSSLVKLSAFCLATLAVALVPFGTHAATQYVILDPNLTWNGFETVYTNGLNDTIYPFYKSDYVGAGPSLPLQASIDSSGTVTIAPDVRMDQLFPTDTLIWADASG